MDNRARSGSGVILILLALIMAPILWIIMPVAFDLMGDVDTSSWGPGIEAIWVSFPHITILIMFAFIVAWIIKR